MVVVVVVVVAALWACFIMSFKPFGRSGRVTHATKISFDDDDDDFAFINQRD